MLDVCKKGIIILVITFDYLSSKKSFEYSYFPADSELLLDKAFSQIGFVILVQTSEERKNYSTLNKSNLLSYL